MRRFHRNPYFKLLMILAGLGLLLFVIWFAVGGRVGDDCRGNWDCFGFGTFCVHTREPFGSTCTRECAGPADCPAGMACRQVPLFERQTVSLRVKTVCLPLPAPEDDTF